MGKKRYSEEELNAFEQQPKEDTFEDVIYLANSKRDRAQEVQEQPVPAVEPERVGAGRPKVLRKVERGKPMNVYFDPHTHQLLKNMKFYHDIEMKDIPYVLTREFFKKYEVDGRLSVEGVTYLQRLLEEVN